MKLPIEIIPNTNPPRFKWEQVFDATGNPRIVQCEGVFPASMESAVAALIGYAKARDAQLADAEARIHALEEEISKRPPIANASIPQGSAAGKRSK